MEEKVLYPVIDKDLALLLALGLYDTNGSDHVQLGDPKLFFRVRLLLGLSQQGSAVLLLDLLGRRGALGLLGLDDAIGGGAL